jgi:S-adenosylmethionine/arginine decarboxylase-like enzyme
MIYLLAESHLSIHTFVDEGKITLDLFICSLGVEYDKIKSIIKDFFDVHLSNIDAYYFTRGSKSLKSCNMINSIKSCIVFCCVGVND